MKCHKCKKKFKEITQLTEFGMNRVGKRDDKEYCEKCFNEKYGDKLHEKSNNKE